MLDVCLLGTSGMMPLPRRFLTAMMCRYNGSSVLIDCGEGTQVAIKSKGWTFKPIDVICITHFHADHISGLPGLLLTMGNADRTEPVTIIGPRGLEKVVTSLRVVAPELPFEVKYMEMSEKDHYFDFDGLKIHAFRVNHNVVCYGYSLSIDRAGKFNAERAKELEIPLAFWNRLQKGEAITDGDKTYTPQMVLGEERKGLKVTYCTDTRPTKEIEMAANESDLFICEGMYGEEEKIANAKEHKHMMFKEAAMLAKNANVKELWLTHFSPALVRPKDFMGDVCKIFPNSFAGKDGKSVDLLFDDNE